MLDGFIQIWNINIKDNFDHCFLNIQYHNNHFLLILATLKKENPTNMIKFFHGWTSKVCNTGKNNITPHTSTKDSIMSTSEAVPGGV